MGGASGPGNYPAGTGGRTGRRWMRKIQDRYDRSAAVAVEAALTAQPRQVCRMFCSTALAKGIRTAGKSSSAL